MAVPIFGIGPSSFEGEFYKSTFTDGVWPAQIQAWAEAASATLEVTLTGHGYTIADIEALGETAAAYRICKEFITQRCVSQIASGATQQNPEKAQRADSRAASVLRVLSTKASSLVAKEDLPNPVRGVFSTGSSRRSRGKRRSRGASRLICGLKGGG